MPVAVTKYTCQFQCGKKAVGKINDMNRHESVCWKNPENKTCKTCTNEIYTYESSDDGYGSGSYYRGCKLATISNILESAHEIMSHQNSLHVRPVYHCPYWCKQADDKTETFAEELFSEIDGEEEGTSHYPFFNKPIKKKDENISEMPF